MSTRPSLLRRCWNWYLRFTGYEQASLKRQTGLRIRSTALPPDESSAPRKRNDLLDGII